ncbi:50S ribosomal protein L23 [Candidatus Woesearchaeota archaeon]|nr:50S ribosomal protein L23 [Candidatus Woesearchaeota archaeon]
MKAIVTEKAVLMIERDNTLVFEDSKNKTKEEVKEELEKMFKIKVEKIRTKIHENKKYFFVKLKKEFVAMDIASKLGLI